MSIFYKEGQGDYLGGGDYAVSREARLWWFAPSVVLGAITALAIGVGFFWWGVGGSVRTYQHHMDAQACQVWGKQTDRPVRFTNYNFWSWGCLTPGFNGKWVTNTQYKFFAPNTSNLNVGVTTR